jgi:hypothetical protein
VKEDCSTARNVCTGGSIGSAGRHEAIVKGVGKNRSRGVCASSVNGRKVSEYGTGAVEGKLPVGNSRRCSGMLFASGSNGNDCPWATVSCICYRSLRGAFVSGACCCKVCACIMRPGSAG